MGQNRTVGPVTSATAVGGGLGAALAQILVHLWPYLEPVESAVTVVLTAILALVAGYLVPPKDPEGNLVFDEIDLEESDMEPEVSTGAHAELEE